MITNNNEVICFHLTTEPNAYLSNWYPSVFEIDDGYYCCAEQYLMATKALLFDDFESAEAIMQTENPLEMQKLGRAVVGYDNDIWTGARQVVARRALKAKFSQNPLLRERLISTGDAILAECSRRDRIWGNGMGMDDPYRFCVGKWPGKNLLGFTLMIVRDELSETFSDAEQKTPLLNAFAERLYHAAKMVGESGIITSVSFEEMRSFGLSMDCGHSFEQVFGLRLGDYAELERSKSRIDDAFVLGSAIYSWWRYFTHWAQEPMEAKDIEWFALAGRLLFELTEQVSAEFSNT